MITAIWPIMMRVNDISSELLMMTKKHYYDNDSGKLFALRETRQTLEVSIVADLDNIINTRLELKYYRDSLESSIKKANKIRKTIVRKKCQVVKICEQMSHLLSSYQEHLTLMARQADEECRYDCQELLEGNYDDYQQFLDSYIDHKKDSYLLKAKSKKLATEIQYLKSPAIADIE